MKLPETPNANYQYAFKKGYRLAAEGKSMATIPSSVRADFKMREYFQQGWQQFHEDMAEAAEEKDSPWRKRFAWWSMMAVAGIATALLMISNIQTEKQQQYTEQTTLKHHASEEIYTKQSTPELENPTLQVTDNQTDTIQSPEPPETLSLLTPVEDTIVNAENPSIKKEMVPIATPKPVKVELSLLSETQRSDLALTKQQYETERKQNQQTSPSKLITNAPQKVIQASLTTAIKNREITEELTGIIPKHIRKLYFFTQIEQASGEKIYHRWLFDDQVLATVPLSIKASPYRTWSSKRLSSAWQGSWRIEVLNEKMQVIHVEKFNYVK